MRKHRISSAAEFLGIRPGTLRNLCLAGKGPRHYRFGSIRVFDEADLRAYLEARVVAPSEAA